MIVGIGTDIVAIERLDDVYRRHGERALEKILAPDEYADCRASTEPARFLAKRFAAKEALGKALGTGVRSPVLLPSIAVTHDAMGKPGFRFADELATFVGRRSVHLSLSDEAAYAVAFVVVESA